MDYAGLKKFGSNPHLGLELRIEWILILGACAVVCLRRWKMTRDA